MVIYCHVEKSCTIVSKYLGEFHRKIATSKLNNSVSEQVLKLIKKIHAMNKLMIFVWLQKDYNSLQRLQKLPTTAMSQSLIDTTQSAPHKLKFISIFWNLKYSCNISKIF